jgi:hypothetical protein
MRFSPTSTVLKLKFYVTNRFQYSTEQPSTAGAENSRQVNWVFLRQQAWCGGTTSASSRDPPPAGRVAE